ncbi:MAG: hypothetical protein PSX36_04945 [bacterium]|nr:hypothetical protein [bacterium]
MKNVKEYYKLLGKLAYSVAIADGVIQEEERDALRKGVLSDFAMNESAFDSSGMNKAFYVDFEFDEGNQQQPDMYKTLKKFADFIEENYERTDLDLLQRSTLLLEKVANAYSKSKEKIIIETLKNKINATLFI